MGLSWARASPGPPPFKTILGTLENCVPIVPERFDLECLNRKADRVLNCNAASGDVCAVKIVAEIAGALLQMQVGDNDRT